MPLQSLVLLQQVALVAGMAVIVSAGVWALAGVASRVVDPSLAGISRTIGLAVVWCVALAIVLKLMNLDAWRLVAGPAIRLLLIVGVAWLADTILVLAIDRLQRFGPAAAQENATERNQRISTLARVTRRIGGVIIALLAGMMALREFGVEISPIIAGASVLGLAISLGAQLLVRDLIAGLLILAENQFAVGDVISVGAITGEVEAMTLRITSLRDLEGALHIVPNGELRILSNKTRSWARAVVDVQVSRTANLSETMETLSRVAQEVAEDPEIKPDLLEAPRITGVEALGDSTMTLRVVAKVKPAQQWAVARAIRMRINTALGTQDAEAKPEEPAP